MELLWYISQKALQVTYKAVDIALAGRLVNDVLVIVVSKSTAQLFIVHLRLVLPFPPTPGNLQDRETNVIFQGWVV